MLPLYTLAKTALLDPPLFSSSGPYSQVPGVWWRPHYDRERKVLSVVMVVPRDVAYTRNIRADGPVVWHSMHQEELDCSRDDLMKSPALMGLRLRVVVKYLSRDLLEEGNLKWETSSLPAPKSSEKKRLPMATTTGGGAAGSASKQRARGQGRVCPKP